MHVELKMEAFLAELSRLSQKYGYVISSCSCCEGTWVFEERRKGQYKVCNELDEGKLVGYAGLSYVFDDGSGSWGEFLNGNEWENYK